MTFFDKNDLALSKRKLLLSLFIGYLFVCYSVKTDSTPTNKLIEEI